MTFDEWFHKEYEPADLQIKQYAERKEGLHIPAKVYLEDLKKAYEAGQKADVHTDNSKVIANLEAQIEEMKCCGNCVYFQFLNDAGYRTCIKDGKRNGKNYRSCEFNLEKWEIKENE